MVAGPSVLLVDYLSGPVHTGSPDPADLVEQNGDRAEWNGDKVERNGDRTE